MFYSCLFLTQRGLRFDGKSNDEDDKFVRLWFCEGFQTCESCESYVRIVRVWALCFCESCDRILEIVSER